MGCSRRGPRWPAVIPASRLRVATPSRSPHTVPGLVCVSSYTSDGTCLLRLCYEDSVASALACPPPSPHCSLLTLTLYPSSLWGKPGPKQPVWQGTEPSCQKPCEWAWEGFLQPRSRRRSRPGLRQSTASWPPPERDGRRSTQRRHGQVPDPQKSRQRIRPSCFLFSDAKVGENLLHTNR